MYQMLVISLVFVNEPFIICHLQGEILLAINCCNIEGVGLVALIPPLTLCESQRALHPKLFSEM